jgi:hypothetical protein
VIDSKIKVSFVTPFGLGFPVSMKTKMFLTCGHVPCKEKVCKYLCQVSDPG